MTKGKKNDFERVEGREIRVRNRNKTKTERE